VNLGSEGMKVVAYRYEKEKYCKKCFERVVGNQRVNFSPVYLAVQVLSCVKKC
jgi:hypothetical protein